MPPVQIGSGPFLLLEGLGHSLGEGLNGLPIVIGDGATGEPRP